LKCLHLSVIFPHYLPDSDGNNPSQFRAATASTTTSDRLSLLLSGRCRGLQGGERAVGDPAVEEDEWISATDSCFSENKPFCCP
ncbi:hypothetical protein AMECASPLE_030334, partial [Ameca splendens]